MSVEIHCSHDKVIKLSELKPNPDNPNMHPPEQIKKLATIILKQGWRSPITVSTLSGLVVKGHGRLEAALLAGLKEAPVDLQSYPSKAAEIADLLADNQIAELSFLDNDLLKQNLDFVFDSEIDFDLSGFDDDIFETLKKETTDEDDFLDDDFEFPDGDINEKVAMSKITIFVEEPIRRDVFRRIAAIAQEYADGQMRMVK
jgi:hypothetical protein